ncbi:MAG: outer membrane protein [Bauldia sp.]
MSIHRSLLAGAAALLAMTSTSAFAADPIVVVPQPPPPPVVVAPIPASLFSGPYIGVIIGAVSGHKHWDSEEWGTTEHHLSGLLLGVEAGFRFQPNSLVFGIEGDIAWTNADGAGPCRDEQDAFTCGTELNYLATLTGQVGFAPGNFLIYAEAGFAWANEDFTVTDEGDFLMTGNTRNSGWVLGGGVVAAMGERLYVKGEYNYINFGTETGIGMTGDAEATFDLTQHAHVFKLGVGVMF